MHKESFICLTSHRVNQNQGLLWELRIRWRRKQSWQFHLKFTLAELKWQSDNSLISKCKVLVMWNHQHISDLSGKPRRSAWRAWTGPTKTYYQQMWSSWPHLPSCVPHRTWKTFFFQHPIPQSPFRLGPDVQIWFVWGNIWMSATVSLASERPVTRPGSLTGVSLRSAHSRQQPLTPWRPLLQENQLKTPKVEQERSTLGNVACRFTHNGINGARNSGPQRGISLTDMHEDTLETLLSDGSLGGSNLTFGDCCQLWSLSKLSHYILPMRM